MRKDKDNLFLLFLSFFRADPVGWKAIYKKFGIGGVLECIRSSIKIHPRRLICYFRGHIVEERPQTSGRKIYHCKRCWWESYEKIDEESV